MKEWGLTNEKETPRMDFTKGFFNEKKMDNYFSHKFPRSMFLRQAFGKNNHFLLRKKTGLDF